MLERGRLWSIANAEREGLPQNAFGFERTLQIVEHGRKRLFGEKIIRLNAQCGPTARLRVGIVPLGRKREGQIEMRLGVVRFQPDRVSKRGNGLIQPPLGAQEIAEIVQHIGLFRFERERLPIEFLGLVGKALGRADDPHQLQCIRCRHGSGHKRHKRVFRFGRLVAIHMMKRGPQGGLKVRLGSRGLLVHQIGSALISPDIQSA